MTPPRPERREIEAFDQGEVDQLLEAARGTRVGALVLLAVATGLRCGELLGLRWQDVDLDAGRLAVRQALQKTKAGGLGFKSPKSKRSRVVAPPPIAVDALRRQRTDQARERLLLGPAYQDHGLVLARADGRPGRP